MTLPYLLFENFDHLLTTPAAVEQLNAAILQLAVQGKLAPQDPNDEPASELLKRIRAERAKNGKAENLPSACDDEKLFGLPKGWEWAFIGEVCETTSGGTPSRRNPDYFDGDIPWIKSGELEDTLIEKAEEKISTEGLANSSAKIFPAGTPLVALYGATVGRTGLSHLPAEYAAACGGDESGHVSPPWGGET